jgi:general secretion pathway protein G
MTAYRTRKSGFTLVEILIVVIILGILAAIVIPQFTNASEDARKNSVTSQLQTIRSQLALSSVQHLDNAPPNLVTPAANPWMDLTEKTDGDKLYTADPAAGTCGPYLNSPPSNPLNNGTLVSSISGNEPKFGDAVAGGSANTGWVFHVPTGKIFATTKTGGFVYDETGTLNNAEN